MTSAQTNVNGENLSILGMVLDLFFVFASVANPNRVSGPIRLTGTLGYEVIYNNEG